MVANPARVKRKVQYRGKNCVILLPDDPARGGVGQPPVPLTVAEVRERFAQYEQLGYQMSSHDAWEKVTISYDAQHHAANRAIWPDEAERQAARGKASVAVSLPNTKEWDAQQQKILDDKLRALGVTTGDEEPVPLPIARSASVQPIATRPFSPPVRTASAGAQFPTLGSLAAFQYPQGFVPGSSHHSSRASIASPISSMGGQRPSLHMHRQSMFSPPTLQQIQAHALQTAGLGKLSPQPMMSPSLLQSLSPTSMPFAIDAGRLSPSIQQLMGGQPLPQFSQRDELLAQLHMQQRQQAQLQQHLQQQQQAILAAQSSRRPSSNLPDVKEVDDEVEPIPSAVAGPEIINTRPSHKHNISQKLEEDVQKMLEKQDKEFSDGEIDEDKPDSAPNAASMQSAESQEQQPVSADVKEAVASEKVAEQDVKAQTEDNVASIAEKPTNTEPIAPAPVEEEAVSSTLPHLRPDVAPFVFGKKEQSVPLNLPVVEAKAAVSSPAPNTSREDPLAFKEQSEPADTEPMDNSACMSSPQSRYNGSEALGGSPNPWRDDATFRSRASSTARHVADYSHASGASISGLNVGAKEFNPSKMNPAATFKPRITSQSSFSFQSVAAAKPFVPRSVSGFTPTSHQDTTPQSPAPTSNPVQTSPFKFGSTPRQFSFTASAPAFNPSATVFSPSSSGFHSDRSVDETDLRSSIFGKIDFDGANMGKAVKKTKAVPILPPPSAPESPAEDDDGRIMQGDERTKRVRHATDDGDQVPQFAIASSPPRPTQDYGSPVAEYNFDSPHMGDAHIPDVRFPKIRHDRRESGEEHTDDMGMDGAKSSHLTVNVQTPTKIKPLVSPRSSSLSALAAPFVFSPEKAVKASRLQVAEPEPEPPVEKIEEVAPKSATPVLAESPILDEQDQEATLGAEIPEVNIERPGSHLSMTSHDVDHISFQDIDAVIEHFKEEGSDAGVERDEPSWPASSVAEHPLSPVRIPHLQSNEANLFRSDAPSPSPRRASALSPARLEQDSISQDPFSDTRAALAYESPVHNLNRGDAIPQSEWDDILSSAEEHRMQAKSSFFDRRVSNLISDAVSLRLSPLEKTLASIQSALEARPSPPSSRRVRSRATVDSDADDEDDDDATMNSRSRNWSPRRDFKMDKFRTILQEALAAQQTPPPTQAPVDMSAITSMLSEVKTTMLDSTSQMLRSDDIASLLAQSQAQTTQQRDARAQIENERLSRLVESLENANKNLQLEQKEKHDLAMQLAEKDRLLKIADEEIELLKADVKDDTAANTAVHEELAAAKEQIARLEAEKKVHADATHKSSHETRELQSKHDQHFESARKADLRVRELEVELVEATNASQDKIDLLNADNKALRDTLEEYRISKNKWQQDLQEAARERDNVQKAASVLKIQMDETARIKESMRTRIEKLHDEMSGATAQIAQERVSWQKADAEHRIKFEVLQARAEAEARTRERLEQEMDRLEKQEREGMKLRVVLEQTQKEVGRLETLTAALRLESSEYQKAADKYAAEFREARDQGRIEVQRTTQSLQRDLEVANHQVNSVRAELENEVGRLRVELEQVKLDADTAKAKHELDLEEAIDTHREAAREAAVQIAEMRKSFEELATKADKQHRRDLDHVIENKNQSETFLRDSNAQTLEELKDRHARDLEQLLEDKQSSEALLNERLGLTEEKAEHLQDKILHLEEKLEIAKSAAHAAALAAKSTKASALETAPSFARSVSEKINPQALRETIAVLQDQLQEREGRIEQLEQELDEVDAEAPMKIKHRDTEIAWLRELLAVRMDDLTDVVNALGQPDFDREAVRNAAIRIRSSLQMEQQEKERQASGGAPAPLAPVIASLSNFASPRAAQISAAFGNWRKGKDFIPSGLSQTMSNLSSANGTPSRPPTSSSFLSGLMTPPASNIRRTPSPSMAREMSTESNPRITRPLENEKIRPRTESSSTIESGPALAPPPARFSAKRSGKQPAMLTPSTPPLLRRTSYDEDAEESTAGFYDDDETSVEGTPRGFGPLSQRKPRTASGSLPAIEDSGDEDVAPIAA